MKECFRDACHVSGLGFDGFCVRVLVRCKGKRTGGRSPRGRERPRLFSRCHQEVLVEETLTDPGKGGGDISAAHIIVFRGGGRHAWRRMLGQDGDGQGLLAIEAIDS